MTDWIVRVPASSANLGAGFDVLGFEVDPRKVERKKPGRPKARKRFQFSKR